MVKMMSSEFNLQVVALATDKLKLAL